MNANDRKEMNDFGEKLDGLNKNVAHLLFIMQSDPKTKEKGLVERVRLIETKLTDLLKREEIYKAKGTVWGIIGGAIATTIFWFGKYFLTKLI